MAEKLGLNDTDKLKRLAEAWKKWGEKPYADAILALIAKNERLKARNARLSASISDAVLERNEAVALLRRLNGYDFAGSPIEDQIIEFLARIKEE